MSTRTCVRVDACESRYVKRGERGRGALKKGWGCLCAQVVFREIAKNRPGRLNKREKPQLAELSQSCLTPTRLTNAHLTFDI